MTFLSDTWDVLIHLELGFKYGVGFKFKLNIFLIKRNILAMTILTGAQCSCMVYLNAAAWYNYIYPFMRGLITTNSNMRAFMSPITPALTNACMSGVTCGHSATSDRDRSGIGIITYVRHEMWTLFMYEQLSLYRSSCGYGKWYDVTINFTSSEW